METISVTTHMPSPPDVVWKILTDFPTYAGWNPFITRASGDPKIGHKQSIRIVPRGGGGMTFRPRVTALEPEQLLEWFGTLRNAGARRWPPRLRPRTHGMRNDSHSNGDLLRPIGATHDRGTSKDKKGFGNMNNALLSPAGSWPSASTQPEAPE